MIASILGLNFPDIEVILSFLSYEDTAGGCQPGSMSSGIAELIDC
jgi:hypothetical protein